MRRGGIQLFTFACLAAAVLVALAGVLAPDPSNKFGLTSEALALTGAISGVFAERWVAARERRDQALHALATELERNASVLEDSRFAPLGDASPSLTVYPRLLIFATETVLISGALEDVSNERLLARLHGWRNLVYEFNHRLDVTEQRLLTLLANQRLTSEGREEIRHLHRAMHTENGYLDEVKVARGALAEHVLNTYGGDPFIATALHGS